MIMNITELCVNCKQNNRCTMCQKTSNKKCPHFIQKTNADRIRAMNDDELAKMLWEICRNYRAVCADPVVDYNEHRDSLIAWLKQPEGRKGE